MLTRINRRTGERRAINIWPDNPMGSSASDITERFQWTFPIVIAPADPKTLYATSQHVWKSTNEGQSWRRISPDLTRHDPATLGPSGGPITLDQTGVETYATVFTLAPSALDGNTIWAGSDSGLVHVTRDGGKNWANVTPPDLPPFTRVSLIDASPHDAGTAYLAGNRYQRSDRAPYVYKTSDYGKRWTKIVNGVPAGDFPRAIREDPKAQGTVVSRDRNGLLFLPRRRKRVATPADWLASHTSPRHSDQERRPRDRSSRALVLCHAEHRHPAAGLAGDHHEPVVLFDPSDAIRSVSPNLTIDYYLKQPAEKVTVEILDAADKTVRTFTGTPYSLVDAAAGEGWRRRRTRWRRRRGWRWRPRRPPPRVGVASGSTDSLGPAFPALTSSRVSSSGPEAHASRRTSWTVARSGSRPTAFLQHAGVRDRAQCRHQRAPP